MSEAALRAAILTAPDDNLPRLVYADWLDDNKTALTCPVCKGHKGWYADVGHTEFVKCSTCEASGWVSDGRPERAAFIRCQVELSTFDSSYYLSFDNCAMCERSAVPLVRRSAELLHLAWGEELRGWGVSGPTLFNSWEFRRGFPDVLSAPLREAWGPGNKLPAWRAAYPATGVRIPNLRPERHFLNDDRPVSWNCYSRYDDWLRYHHYSWALPPDLFDLLDGKMCCRGAGQGGYIITRTYREYPNTAEAVRDVERAVWAAAAPSLT